MNKPKFKEGQRVKLVRSQAEGTVTRIWEVIQGPDRGKQVYDLQIGCGELCAIPEHRLSLPPLPSAREQAAALLASPKFRKDMGI